MKNQVTLVAMKTLLFVFSLTSCDEQEALSIPTCRLERYDYYDTVNKIASSTKNIMIGANGQLKSWELAANQEEHVLWEFAYNSNGNLEKVNMSSGESIV